MLVLTVKKDGSVWVGETEVKVTEVKGDKIKLAFNAPQSVRIVRGEVKKAA